MDLAPLGVHHDGDGEALLLVEVNKFISTAMNRKSNKSMKVRSSHSVFRIPDAGFRPARNPAKTGGAGALPARCSRPLPLPAENRHFPVGNRRGSGENRCLDGSVGPKRPSEWIRHPKPLMGPFA